jgi:hypothetical protein
MQAGNCRHRHSLASGARDHDDGALINNAPSIDIAGTAEPNSTVTLYNGASVVGTATVNGSGNGILTVSP